MKNVSIALLGCGTVGKGVIDLLAMNGPLIEEHQHQAGPHPQFE